MYRFRFIYDYSGGQVTNYGAHSNDMAQWALGTDGTGPVEVECLDAKFLPEGSLFNAATETRFRCRYANGVELVCETEKSSVGARFEGTEGMVQVG
ncbi:MAG: gfo/Idh/MocA family oxidoreductase, partial [Thermoguttaceae bacterium]|nr:gfo/Idh/MocA family oxidoreductase [Thermoguttaceae bacterium]